MSELHSSASPTPSVVAHDSAGAIASFLKRPVAALTMLAVLVALGLIAYFRIPIQLLPGGWGSQTFTVFINNPNSNPRETEERVTRLVEEQVRTIPGVRHVRSTSGADNARIRVEFGGEQDLDVAYAELRDRMEKIRPQLPRGADRYTIFRFSLDESTPIFFGGLLFDLDPSDPKVNDICENILKRRIEGVDGVARMDIRGTLDESIRILLDVDRVRAHRVNLIEVVDRLQKDNFAAPVGKLEEAGERVLLRVDSRYKDEEEIRNTPITDKLRVRDVGEVKRIQAIRETLSRINGKFALFCSISKSSGANTVATCERVVAAMEELEKRDDVAGFKFNPWFNQGKMIRRSLDDLESAAKDGAIWSVAVLFFFLRRVRLTLLIALSIPVSLLATLVSLYFAGSTFNMISMAGITLAIGSLVDNAVVVVENIHRKKESGLALKQAVVEGAGEVAVAITLATLTSIVVFIPLMLLGDDRNLRVGMTALGFPFSVALGASLAAALIFIPVALYRLEKDDDSPFERRLARVRAFLFWPFTAPMRLLRRTSESTPAAGRVQTLEERSFVLRSLSRINLLLVTWSLKHRFAAAILALAVVATTQIPASKVQVAASGGEDGQRISLRIDLPQNTTLRQASEEFLVYERLLDTKREELGFEDLSSDFSRQGGDIAIWFRRSFTDKEKEEIRKRVRALLPDRPTSFARLEGGGRSESAAGVEFVLIGRDSDELARYAERAKDLLSHVPELTNIRTELERGRPELRVRVNREQAQRLALNPTNVSGAIEWGLRGFLLSRIQEQENERQLIIQYEDSNDADLADLADTKLFSPTAGEVPLAAVATFEVGKGYGQIFRRDGRTALQISADVLEGDAKTATARARAALEPLFTEMSRDVKLEEQGALFEFRRNEGEIFSALWLSIALVFVVMGVMFESAVLPLSILVTIPYAFFGAYWTLFLTGTAMDMLGLLGLIVLVGVVVNHGVVLVDHINFLRVKYGMERSAAVIQGAQDRLRPVLMTSLTTIAGLIPMALARETGGEGLSYLVLSRIVCGGLITSTFFTLWVVPLCYTFFDDLSIALRRTWVQAAALLRPGSAAPVAEPAT